MRVENRPIISAFGPAMLASTRMREGCALIKTKQCIDRSTEFEREFATAVSKDEYRMKRRRARGEKAQAGPPEKKKKQAEAGQKLFPRTLAAHVRVGLHSWCVTVTIREIGWKAEGVIRSLHFSVRQNGVDDY